MKGRNLLPVGAGAALIVLARGSKCGRSSASSPSQLTAAINSIRGLVDQLSQSPSVAAIGSAIVTSASQASSLRSSDAFRSEPACQALGGA